jgi:hypothetical protein
MYIYECKIYDAEAVYTYFFSLEMQGAYFQRLYVRVFQVYEVVSILHHHEDH